MAFGGAAQPQAAEPAGKSAPRLQKGAVLAIAAVAIGLVTTLTSVVIELSSDILADLRHGVCIAHTPGDTEPLWHSTLGGGWRPYDRMHCCGGSDSVDHDAQECRVASIIKHSQRKRMAKQLHLVQSFGAEPASELPSLALRESSATVQRGLFEADTLQSSLQADLVEVDRDAEERQSHQAASHRARSAHVQDLVGRDATRVRSHMSHLFAPDPMEHWGQETVSNSHSASLVESEDMVDVAVNEGVIQTQSESAGSLDPTYEWVPWERALRGWGKSGAPIIYVVGCGLLAMLSAVVTRSHPQCKGSGIPEVKASCAGWDLPAAFRPQTLAAKVVALVLCVGAGLALGKEGPMIHIGACWAVLLAGPISRLAGEGGLPIAENELICVGAATGMAAAFGAPLAGVLFAVEELGTTMPAGLRYSTMLCAFGSAVVASLTLKWIDLTRTQRLTLFEVDYRMAWAPWEVLPFALLGVIGGVLGATFVLLNEVVQRRRMAAEAEGRLFWLFSPDTDRTVKRMLRMPAFVDGRVLELLLLGVFTGILDYPTMLTRMMQNDAIGALFNRCHAAGNGTLQDALGLCGSMEDVSSLFSLQRLLLGATALRFVQMTVTIGALSPAGLFVPSLYIGSCFGRSMGATLKYAGFLGAAGGAVEPGIYAMVGAGAMLAGVSRLTISLAVVLFELTGGLTYVVPFMIAVLVAKWTGDALTDSRSVYDVNAELKGMCKVEQSDEAPIINATLQYLSFAAALGGDSKASEAVTPLWMCSRGVATGELMEHCRLYPDGFPVLGRAPLLGHSDEVEVLGWARPSKIMSVLPGKDQVIDPFEKGRADRWYRLVPISAGKGELSLPRHASPGTTLLECLDAKGVVRVRRDCPLHTAHCIFEACPWVSALVSIEGTPPVILTTTREVFNAQLSRGCLHAFPPLHRELASEEPSA